MCLVSVGSIYDMMSHTNGNSLYGPKPWYTNILDSHNSCALIRFYRCSLVFFPHLAGGLGTPFNQLSKV